MHLRAVPTIAADRRHAVERAAHVLYANASLEDEQGTLELLVLQRVIVPLEGLGGLLYALDEAPSFADPSLLAPLFQT